MEPAAGIALRTVIDVLEKEKSPETVVFVLFDKRTFKLYESVLREIINL